MLRPSMTALDALEESLRSRTTTGSLPDRFEALAERMEAVLDEVELPGIVPEGYRLRLRAWREEAASSNEDAVLALRSLVGSARRLIRRLRRRDDPASLEALPLPKDGADRLSPAQISYLLDRLCHPHPPWDLLDRIPEQMLGGTEPVALALARLRETRGPGPSGKYGAQPSKHLLPHAAAHRWALERAPHEPFGVFRLIVEEVHRTGTGGAETLLSLIQLEDRSADPWFLPDHAIAAAVLSARILLYQAEHCSRMGLDEDAENTLERVDRISEASGHPDPELRASLAALRGSRAAKANDPALAHRCYSDAVITALGTEPRDRGPELLTEWLERSLFLPSKPEYLVAALVPLWKHQASVPADHRPLERLRLYRLVAGTLWASCISSIAELMRDCSIDDLEGESVRRALEEHGATLEHLERAAHAASPLVMRYLLPLRQQIQVRQWWARSLVSRDPEAAVALLVEAAELSLAEELEGTLLQVLLDMVWPLLLMGYSGPELRSSEPLSRLLDFRPSLPQSFRSLLTAVLEDGDPQEIIEIFLQLGAERPSGEGTEGGRLH